MAVDEELRADLRRRAGADQVARERLIAQLRPDGTLPDDASALADVVQAIDADNTGWLGEVLGRQGWPGRSRVGDEGAHDAWLIAQHADRDPAFQRECLDAMEEAVARGEASASELAYLTDRVLRHEGRPQRYGTQFQFGPGGLVPQPMEDPEHVDARRAQVGLGPLAEYEEVIRRHYGGEADQVSRRLCANRCGGRRRGWGGPAGRRSGG